MSFTTCILVMIGGALGTLARYVVSVLALPISRDLPWGVAVTLPAGFDLARYRGPFADFARRGVRALDGAPLPVEGEASLFLPGGVGGPVFLLTANFDAIRAYNTSDSYALAVGHFSDRIAGGPPLATPWPTGPRLDQAGLTALQRGLSARALYEGPFDGRAGPKLRDAVRLLDRAAEERSAALLTTLMEPALDPVRAEPEFVALARRVGSTAAERRKS